MKNFLLIGFALLSISTLLSAQDSTFVRGQLVRINYHSNTIDSSSIAPWSQTQIVGFASYSFNTPRITYNESLKILDSTYVIKHNMREDPTSYVIFYTLVNIETKTQYPMGRVGGSDVIGDFYPIEPWWLPVRDGLAFLGGIQQQLFINSENFPNGTPRTFNFENFEDPHDNRTFIVGKISEKYIISHQEGGSHEYGYYLCDIDEDLLVIPTDTLATNFNINNTHGYLPTSSKRVSDSVFVFSDAFESKNIVTVLKSDSLITRDTLVINFRQLFNNDVYYYSYQDSQYVKQSIDTLSGTLSEKKPTPIDLSNTIWKISENSGRMAIWTTDSLKVYSLIQEKYIFSMPLLRKSEEFFTDAIKRFSNLIFIDDTYVYIHRIDTVTDMKIDEILPTNFSLRQNYPNPFNPTTTITYHLVKSGNVTLEVFNMLGEKIITLVKEHQETGKHNISFQGQQLPSGVYFYRLETKGNSACRKMILLK